MSDTTILNMSQRLGLGEQPKVISKAEQFSRLLQTKTAAKLVNDSVKAIVCLDLASNLLGANFDMETAIKLSGMKKSAYKKQHNLIEKTLELDKIITVSEVCVQLSCTVVKELAQDIYKKYREYSVNADFTHPQYITACVYAACKIKKVKVEKSKLVELSHLKPSQWKELEVEFDKFVNNAGFITKSAKKSKANDLEETLEQKCQENGHNSANTTNLIIEEIPEDYEVWKNRVLNAAKAALGKS